MKTFCLELSGAYARFTRPELKVERMRATTPFELRLPRWLLRRAAELFVRGTMR